MVEKSYYQFAVRTSAVDCQSRQRDSSEIRDVRLPFSTHRRQKRPRNRPQSMRCFWSLELCPQQSELIPQLRPDFLSELVEMFLRQNSVGDWRILRFRTSHREQLFISVEFEQFSDDMVPIRP